MPTEVTVRLSIDQLNSVLALLGSHPFNQVADLIMTLRQQAQTQMQQAQVPMSTMMPQRQNGEDRATA